ncbi:MAG: ATP synthase F1 subunit epsilon [Elusimicrobia bacterium RIFOXYC2_FULL_34_12]|nr:MAG: ATP synthase F1 subunit epsilon [Elusimicrobia bacterium RIFOXYC2_FULL_34_12]OGS38508.1 MAG: ATP synthase F1 subunit epsilon [Elusimicrobia bacterium RIFOXYD2_FULL_34_30]
MKTFLLEIITPEKVSYKSMVEFVSFPAYHGEMGVLPGHIDYISLLLPGEIRIKFGEDIQLFAISGGFAEIHNNNVTILCETAESAEEIDIEKAKLEKLRAEEKLKTPDKNFVEIQASLRKAMARLKVVSDLQRRKKTKKQQ